MKKYLLLLVFLLPLMAMSQTSGSIQGKVIDKVTKEELPFVNITLEQGGQTMGGTSSNIDGYYVIKGVAPGKYDIRATSVGYAPMLVTELQINANQIRFFDIEMDASAIMLDADKVVIVEYKVPLIDKDKTCSGGTITMDRYNRTSSRSSSVSSTRGVYSRDGEAGNVRGSRSNTMKPTPVYSQVNTESYSLISENEFHSPVYSPLSTFSIDVDVASYSNMRRFVKDGYAPPANAVRIEEMINYFTYDYPEPEGEVPFSVTTELSACPWNNNLLLHVGIQGRHVDKEDLPPSNLVFLADVSGSMGDENKLPLLKKAMKLLVTHLRAEDRISIVVYAGSSGLLLPPTPGSEKQEIKRLIDKMTAGGSTAGGEGIRLAYKTARENFLEDGNNRVILATDGDFNVGVTDDDELVKLIEEERDHGIFLSVLGFGTGNLQDAKMEKLADNGNGNYAYIDNLLEAQKVLGSEMAGTLFTIAKDVKIQVEFNPSNVVGFRLIGYENRLLADEDFYNDKKDAGEIGAGQSVTALYEIITKHEESGMHPIDELRYQAKTIEAVNFSDELANIKIRYKEPEKSISKLINKAISNEVETDASENFLFSASVAEFGLLIRNSKFKGDASYEQIIDLAKASKGKDENGYRSEFIRLVKLAEDLELSLLED